MPMMGLEPVLQSTIGTPEVTSIAALSGLVVTGSFGLNYLILKMYREEQERNRKVIEKMTVANTAQAEAMREAIAILGKPGR